jgi:hypothetical protein
MKITRNNRRRTGITVVLAGVALAAGVARAAPVTVSGSETWDGAANPHAADGVVLTTNGTTYTYTIPYGMTISAGGSVNLGSSDNGFVFAFTGGQLQIDPGGIFNVGRTVTKSGNTPLTLDLGGAAIVGGGAITNKEIGTRVLTITNVADITLSAIDMSVQDQPRGSLIVRSTGNVNVKLLGNYDSNAGGNSVSGGIDVRAESITVSNVYTYAARPGAYVNGDVLLAALGAPGYNMGATTANDHNNTLTINGRIDTLGGAGTSGGNVLLSGVVVTLGAGFTNDVPTSAVLNTYAGYGGAEHFTNNSAVSITPQYIVSHVEHPNPAIIVTTVEPWDGAQNPRAADGVTLTTNASAYVYTIPKAMQIVYGGRIDVGADYSRNFEFRFTGGNLQIDNGGVFDIGVNGVRYPTGRLLTIDMGGSNIVTDAAVGAGAINNAFPTSTGEYGGTRSLLITNVTDVSIGTLGARADDATKGTITVVASGKVSALLLDNSDPTAGGSSGANITIRAAAIDVLNADTAAYRPSGVANGNILLEALKPPQYDPTQRINTKANTLVLRGTLKTKQAGTSNTGGSVTNRAAVLTLGPSFVGLIGAVSTNFAGDGLPREKYFVNNCTNMAASTNFSFTATHNVQMKSDDGTVLMVW